MSDFTESDPQTPDPQDAQSPDQLPEDDIWARLASETAQIEWGELERFFARGQVVEVSGELDLVEVAMHVVKDDRLAVDRWMQQGQFGLLNSDNARAWASGEHELWAVVVAPWVLVQAR